MGRSQSAGGRNPGTAPPAELIAQAAQHPGEWVAEIDQRLIDDSDGYIPDEAIMGAWEVDARGHLTGAYHQNPRYGPPQDDFTKLTSSEHWFKWIDPDPAGTVKEDVAKILDEQIPGTTIRWMKITDEPQHQVAGKPTHEDEEKTTLTLTRGVLAAPFAIGVDAPARPFKIIWGTYTIVGAGFGSGAVRRRIWFDLWTTLDQAAERFETRIMEV